MPVGAMVLSVQVQRMMPYIWALVDPDLPPLEERLFYVVGTGHPLSDNPGKYIGTFQLLEGGLVFHLFEGLGSHGA